MRRNVVRRVAMAAAAAVLAAALAGCAGLGLSAEEAQLLDAASADAAFVDARWEALAEAERREFVRENALRWRWFGDLAHGRRPAAEEVGDE